MMKPSLRLFLLAAVACLNNAAGATELGQATADNLHWRCWYDQQTHITCVIDTLPQDEGLSQQEFAPHLPPIVRLMRTKPESLGGKIIHIPLLSEPIDFELTFALARSTVCGSRRHCTVKFSENLPPAEEIIALLGKHLPSQGSADSLAMLGGVLEDME